MASNKKVMKNKRRMKAEKLAKKRARKSRRRLKKLKNEGKLL